MPSKRNIWAVAETGETLFLPVPHAGEIAPYLGAPFLAALHLRATSLAFVRFHHYAHFMDLPARKRLSHAIPPWVTDGSFYFLTLYCELRNENQLCRENIGDEIFAATGHNHEKSVWHCRLCLLMPDHLHAIIAFPPEPGIKTIVSNWKRFVATKCGVQWQRDFFDHRLRDHHELQAKEGYILMNPVRKGLCATPEEWPWIFRPPREGDLSPACGTERKIDISSDSKSPTRHPVWVPSKRNIRAVAETAEKHFFLSAPSERPPYLAKARVAWSDIWTRMEGSR